MTKALPEQELTSQQEDTHGAGILWASTFIAELLTERLWKGEFGIFSFMSIGDPISVNR